MSEPKVVYTPPNPKYLVQLRTAGTDWGTDQGFQDLHSAKEHADKSAQLFLNLQVRVVEVSDQ